MAHGLRGITWISQWLWPIRTRWKRRVLFEDALKFIHEREETGQPVTPEELASAIGIPPKSLPGFVGRLREIGYLEPEREGDRNLRLTAEGRQEALRIVRLHRLWERYLAEQTGLAPEEWHAAAHRLEHTTTPETANSLAAQLGFPRFDPHGDPIPTETGEIAQREGTPISESKPGDVVQVCHIEDEPLAAYQELLAHDLHLGTPLRVEKIRQDGVTVRHQGQTIRLSPEASANLWVKAAPETESKPWEQPRATLADLQVGEVGIVKGISPQCRGLQRRRLLDLGFVPGTRVVAELRSPSGDPTAYRVRNTLIALRRDQAQLIDIEPIHAGSSTTPLQPVQNQSP